MIITSKGYPLKFIQTEPVGFSDTTCHIKSYIFKFFSPKTKLLYIVRAEEHENDFFTIKFYAKKDRKSDRKYFNVINKGDVIPIVVTATKSIPEILKFNNKASFGFIASRGIDLNSNKIESVGLNQRFKLYEKHIPQLIGNKTFQHISYKEASSYALINRSVGDVKKYESIIKYKLERDYVDLVNL